MFVCKLKGKLIPRSVSVVREIYEDQRKYPNHVLIQSNSLPEGVPLRNISVCVMSPLFIGHNSQKIQNRLINFIEINRLFGAEWFTFYKYSVSGEVDLLLRHYLEAGMIEVHQWPLPSINIHYYAQQLAFHDCLYRNLKKSKYLAVLDFDEIIVPHKVDTWQKTISSIEADSRKDWCAFMFRNVFLDSVFHCELTETHNTYILNMSIDPLLRTRRDKSPWPNQSRSKLIINTKFAQKIGVHLMWTCLDSTTTYSIPENIGLLHHYRSGKFKKQTVRDNTVCKFKDQIVKVIHERYKSLKQKPASVSKLM